jgi:hypothetical protein
MVGLAALDECRHMLLAPAPGLHRAVLANSRRGQSQQRGAAVRYMNGMPVRQQLRMRQRAEGQALALASQTDGNQ